MLEDHFTRRLAKLHEISVQLTRITTLDELCRQAVLLGRSLLDFDRVGIWLVGESPDQLVGMFGTDHTGELRDERGWPGHSNDNPLLVACQQQPTKRYTYQIKSPIYDLDHTVLGLGWEVVAALWDGETTVGYLFVDNLLRRRPYTDHDGELLALYATMLGHLCARVRIEESLRHSRNAEVIFGNRLIALSRVATQLTRSASIDEFCRNAITWGLSELDFDRMGLWFTSPTDPHLVFATYGTDEYGKVCDENGISKRFADDDILMGYALQYKARYTYKVGIPISHPVAKDRSRQVGEGWVAAAALWDGEAIIGYLFADNLLRQRPYSERDGELLSLYAATLGHLCGRLRLEENLRQREATYRALIAAIPDALFMLSCTGTIVEFYEAQTPLFSLTRTTLVGQPLTAIWNAEVAQQYLQAIQNTCQTGRTATLAYSQRMGEILRHFEVRITPTGDDHVLALVSDRTTRKHLEEQLYAAQKIESLGRMAGGIAHDFNNLLTVIQSFSSLAERLLGDTQPKIQKALQQINTSAEKGARLTQQLLSYASRQVVRTQVINVNPVVLELKGRLQQILGDQVVLLFELTPDLQAVEFDRTQLDQVLLQLATNAQRAMPEGGRFLIKTTNLPITAATALPGMSIPVGQYIMLSVSDTGQGIDEAIQSRIFEPFFTTYSGTSRGLGLAICQGIIQQHGGQIIVQSAVGQGATFHIVLPQATAQIVAETVTSAPLQPADGHETILLVEDDEAVLEATVSSLHMLGYHVFSFRHGQEALGAFLAQPTIVDLLITDMLMPQMNGREVAERARAIRPDLPVLLVSGYVEELPTQLVAKPDVAFLPKPYSAEQLGQTIQAVLRQRKLGAGGQRTKGGSMSADEYTTSFSMLGRANL